MYLKKIFLGKLILLFLLISNSHSLENRIILKINDEIITSQDIQNETKYLIALNPKIIELDEAKIYEISKNSIIRENIKKLEIFKNNKNAKIDDNFLTNIIQTRYKLLGLNDRNEFISYLKKFNIEISSIEEKIGIESLWNQLIFFKFSKNVKINKENLRKNIEKNKNLNKKKDFFLKEIVFNVGKDTNLDKKYNQIRKSILNTGFENTASIYSISDTAKTGGILGWISKDSLSSKINKALSTLNLKEHTKPIRLPSGFLILQISDQRVVKKNINVDKELEKAINTETNKQLNQFSNIYFNKVKQEIYINEI